MLDVSDRVAEEECPLCGARVWRAVVVDLEVTAYFVLLDPNGCTAGAYEPPSEDPQVVGWPRYQPAPVRNVVWSATSGPLWAHGCFVPDVVRLDARGRSDARPRSRMVVAQRASA